jgi:hypothetical protein
MPMLGSANTRQNASVSRLAGLAVLLLVLIHANSVVRADESPTREQLDYFEKHIRPVLVERCYKCHSAKATTLQAGLRVDSAAAMRRGGDSGVLFESGKPGDSLLIAALRWETYEMPPEGKLPDEVVEHFVRWIEMGAPDPREDKSTDLATDSAAADTSRHWAFQPPTLVDPPEVRATDWARTAIDRFVLARLEQNGLAPAAPADRRTLLRRLYYDLTGLPPSADEFAAFESADGTAYEAAVDRLLDSPHFGERWGRYWLDVARYADTKGYVFQEDRNYPHAYTYRDWVIRAFNEDLPYDRFVIAQLAADRIDDPSVKPATGFLTLGRRFINNQHDIIDDRIDVITRGLMGLTVSCPLPRPQVRSDTDRRLLLAVRRAGQFARAEGRRGAAAAGRCRQTVRAGDFRARQPGQPWRPGAAAVSRLFEQRGRQTVRAGQRPLGNGPSDRQRSESADGPRVGEPRLAAIVRRRTGDHSQRFRHAQRPAQSPGAARLAGLQLHATRLVHETVDPGDRLVQRVSSSQRVPGGLCGGGP